MIRLHKQADGKVVCFSRGKRARQAIYNRIADLRAEVPFSARQVWQLLNGNTVAGLVMEFDSDEDFLQAIDDAIECARIGQAVRDYGGGMAEMDIAAMLEMHLASVYKIKNRALDKLQAAGLPADLVALVGEMDRVDCRTVVRVECN